MQGSPQLLFLGLGPPCSESLACSSPVRCLEPQDLCLPNTWFSWVLQRDLCSPHFPEALFSVTQELFQVCLSFVLLFLHPYFHSGVAQFWPNHGSPPPQNSMPQNTVLSVCRSGKRLIQAVPRAWNVYLQWEIWGIYNHPPSGAGQKYTPQQLHPFMAETRIDTNIGEVMDTCGSTGRLVHSSHISEDRQ